MNKKLLLSCVFISIILAYSISVHSRANPEIQELFGDKEELEVIVVLKDDYSVLGKYGISSYKDDFEKKKMMILEQQGGVLEDLKIKDKSGSVSIQSDGNYDFDLTNTYSTVNGFAGKLKKASYEKLKNDIRVERILKPRKISFLLSDSVGIISATKAWGLVYNGLNITGKGQSVCIIDTGVDYTHPSLGNCSSGSFTSGACPKVISGYDFVNDDNDPIDDNGHGTHVAGIVASTNGSIRGIAPDAAIIAIKILNSAGEGAEQDLIDGIDWCINNSYIFNIAVISMSLGVNGYKNTTYCDSSDNPLLVNSIHNAISRNMSVISAAGNNGNSPLGVSSPACISNVTVVGSATKSDSISSFSDIWSLPMLLAPGDGITSTYPNGFATFSGTSMAAPHVAGAFALLAQYKKLEQNLTLTPFQIQDALNGAGKQIQDSGSEFFFSRINIFSAILSLDTLNPGIKLVTPTPENKTNLSLNSTGFFIYINTLNTEVLSSAILEINNGSKTNISMIINGLNSFINLTSLKVGVISFRVYGNDSAGNSNITDQIMLQINNTAPNIFGFEPSNESVSMASPNNKTFSINFTDSENDTITFYWYLNSSLQTSGANKSEFIFTGNFTSAGFYVINATLTDGSSLSYKSWNLTVSNTNRMPNLTSVNLTNTDPQNRTTGDLVGSWSFTDIDGDSISNNETRWYNNSIEVEVLRNLTAVSSGNTTRGDNWTFSVRIFDGFNWSEFANTSILTIQNSRAGLALTSVTENIRETELAIINFTISDSDNDVINITISNGNFTRGSTINTTSSSGIMSFHSSFIWQTKLDDSGVNFITVSVTDGFSQEDNEFADITISDERDFDNDGNPDFNDADDDGDGILDDNDFLVGNSSSLNTTLSINLTINGTSNMSKLLNDTLTISITNGSYLLIEFNFTFNSSNYLDLGNLTITRTINGSSAVSIRGKLNLYNFTKTVFLEKINATAKSVCIKDADASFETISSACNVANEALVKCDNSTFGQYACFDTGTRYRITGLNHSAVKEQCRDNDGDGYGMGCTLGDDSCDSNPIQHTPDGCNPPSSGGSSGGGGGGGGSGGGGSGGGSIGFVCNMDWQCSEWSECINGFQARNCNFAKVPQHVQAIQCPLEPDAPKTTQSCEVKKEAPATALVTKADNVNGQSINQGQNLTAEQGSEKGNKGLSAITGALTKITGKPNFLAIGVAALIIVISAVLFYNFRKNYKK